VFSALASLSGIAARGRSLVAVAVFALALPVFAIKGWSSAYADRLGTGIAASLIAVVPTLPPRSDQDELTETPQVEAPFEVDPGVRGVALDSKHPRQPARPRTATKQGIRVTSAQVLALAARRAMPHALFVKATAEHPAGLLLGGVSALGIGLQDGDILTEAAGQKATSVAVVVGIVLAARSRQASEISGRFYRGGVPFLLTVEQPYPKQQVPG
jgi:S1-C subfamily serine protease